MGHGILMTHVTKPKHAGAFDSPLRAFPGWFSLPDPDIFTDEHWRAWRGKLRTAGALAADNDDATWSFDIAAALLVSEIGEWHIDGADLPMMCVPEHAGKVPLKIRRWLGHRVEEYILGITNPKA